MMNDWNVPLRKHRYIKKVLITHKINDFTEVYEKRQILIKMKLQYKE